MPEYEVTADFTVCDDTANDAAGVEAWVKEWLRHDADVHRLQRVVVNVIESSRKEGGT